MEARVEILYRETHGGGDDTEGNNPNGVMVCLSYWGVSGGDWRVSDHYVLAQRAMIDREWTVDETRVAPAYTPISHPVAIREAIATFDKLVASLPERKSDGR